MKVCTVRLTNNEEYILDKYMSKNNIKTKSEAIRKCIRCFDEQTYEIDMLHELNYKLNRIMSEETLIRNILEQLFANYGFMVNEDIKKDECLKEFYERNNKYSNKILN